MFSILELLGGLILTMTAHSKNVVWLLMSTCIIAYKVYSLSCRGTESTARSSVSRVHTNTACYTEMPNQSTSKALCLIQIRCAEVLRSLWSLISTESRQECL